MRINPTDRLGIPNRVVSQASDIIIDPRRVLLYPSLSVYCRSQITKRALFFSFRAVREL